MRISESQLRRIVRRLISEAPLADYYQTSYVGPNTSMWRTPEEPEPDAYADPRDIEHVRRVYSFPKFKEKLQKLLKNFPVDVYVLPVAVDISAAYGYLPNRFNIFDKSSLKTNPQWIGGKQKVYDYQGVEYTQEIQSITSQNELRNFVESWAESSPPDACLICSFSKSGGDRQQQVTPWTIFHAMFDSAVDSTSYEILDACPSIRDIKKISERLINLLESNEVPIDKLEKIFTMGSARQGYYSKVNSDALFDLTNEIATQAAITTSGFTYNSGAVESLPADDELKEEIVSILDQLIALSPRCKSEFANFLRGKIIFIATYPDN